MATTLHGTVATMAMVSSMARGVLMPMLNLRLRLRLMLRPTTLYMATTLHGTVATMAMASSMARGALDPLLMLNLTTATATGLATPTGRTMEATTTASRGIENRNQMLCLAALNKLV